MKTVEERLKSYEPLWENWTYTGNFLGEGAMSSVFEIESTAMGFREVSALKIVTVKKNIRGEVSVPDSALNEIRILRALSACPNIVHYQDSTQRKIFDENNKLSEIDLLIKMEKLKPLSEGDSLSEKQIIKLATDMCTALDYASSHKIIHRDIKPQNIFVDEEGTYKLGDFGIAKIISDFSGSYTMNIGTLAYTAPEIRINTTGKYDISSDIYSLGLVLYVLLNNGFLPFANTSATLNEAITKRISGASFPSPVKGSKSLKRIVMRACSNDLARRYRTPKEMLEDLELLSTGGKKLVEDPFATADANADVVDFATDSMTVYGERRGASDSGFEAGATSGRSGKLINSMKKSSSSTVESSRGSDAVKINEASSSGSRIRSSMRSKGGTDSSSVMVKKSEENVSYKELEKKEESKPSADSSSFFKTPGSL